MLSYIELQESRTSLLSLVPWAFLHRTSRVQNKKSTGTLCFLILNSKSTQVYLYPVLSYIELTRVHYNKSADTQYFLIMNSQSARYLNFIHHKALSQHLAVWNFNFWLKCIKKDVTKLIIPCVYYLHHQRCYQVNHSHVFITYIIKYVTRLIIPMWLLPD